MSPNPTPNPKQIPNLDAQTESTLLRAQKSRRSQTETRLVSVVGLPKAFPIS
jgi:hypothetical protein